MQPAHYAFVAVVGIQLKRNDIAVDLNDPGETRYLLPERCGREVLDFDVLSDGTLTRL